MPSNQEPKNLFGLVKGRKNKDHKLNSTDENGGEDLTDLHLQASTSPSDLERMLHNLNPAFLCPITKEVFEDPVVAKDGITYERSAIEKLHKFSRRKFYPNRALQTIIKEESDSSTGMSDVSLSIRMMGLVDQEEPTGVLSEREVAHRLQHLRESYCCPITMSVLQVPVIDPDGNTFERDAIHQWIRTHGTSPITRTPLSTKQLYFNFTLACALQETITDSKMVKFDPPASMQFLQIEPTLSDDGDIEEGTSESSGSSSSSSGSSSSSDSNAREAAGVTCIKLLLEATPDLLRVAFFTFVACGCILFWAHNPEFLIILLAPIFVGLCLLMEAIQRETMDMEEN